MGLYEQREWLYEEMIRAFDARNSEKYEYFERLVNEKTTEIEKFEAQTESKLREHIDAGNPAITLFYTRTKGQL